MTTKQSNKGRITRVDQAWTAAHREKAERERIADIAKAYELAQAENIERGRIIDVDAAHAAALSDDAERDVDANRVVIAGPESGQSARLSPPQLAGYHGLPKPSNPSHIVLPLKLITAAMLTTAVHDIRVNLNGLFVHGVDGELRIASTDGHRMTVSRFDISARRKLPEWAADGIIIPRDALVQALPLLAKNAVISQRGNQTSEPAVVLHYEPDTKRITLRAANGFASFEMQAIDSKFPDYARVLAAQGASLARGEGEAMRVSAIKTAYLKGAADTAARLGAAAVHAFVSGDSKGAHFFTFDGSPDTVLIVMPMAAGEPISDGVVRILGKGGTAASLAALRAHLTRATKALESVKGDSERQEFESKRDRLQVRIANILAMTTEGPKQIEQKSA